VAVVARLNCISIEETQWTKTVKFQPVVPSDDPHSEEIKAFFVATPSGTVFHSVPADTVLTGVEPGKQFYLHQRAALDVEDDQNVVTVTGVRLDGWATHVTLKNTGPTPVWEPWKIEFVIRNEVAAEQFQVGSRFCVELQVVPVNG